MCYSNYKILTKYIATGFEHEHFDAYPQYDSFTLENFNQ